MVRGSVLHYIPIKASQPPEKFQIFSQVGRGWPFFCSPTTWVRSGYQHLDFVVKLPKCPRGCLGTRIPGWMVSVYFGILCGKTAMFSPRGFWPPQHPHNSSSWNVFFTPELSTQEHPFHGHPPRFFFVCRVHLSQIRRRFGSNGPFLRSLRTEALGSFDGYLGRMDPCIRVSPCWQRVLWPPFFGWMCLLQ